MEPTYLLNQDKNKNDFIFSLKPQIAIEREVICRRRVLVIKKPNFWQYPRYLVFIR